MGVDAIDSTFAVDLPSCFQFMKKLRSDTGGPRFIYDTSLSGAVEEKTLSTGSAPFPLMYKLTIAGPAADSGDPRDMASVMDRNAIKDLLRSIVWRKTLWKRPANALRAR